MTSILVRAAETEDAAAINEVASCPNVRYGTLQMPFQSVASRRKQLEREDRDHFRIVAEVDGRVVGIAGLQLLPNPRQRHAGQIGMGVHDDFQGQGIGRALLDALLDLADNWLGLLRVELTVYPDNEPALHLYRSSGFEMEGTLRKYALRNGVYVDAVMMSRIRK